MSRWAKGGSEFALAGGTLIAAAMHLHGALTAMPPFYYWSGGVWLLLSLGWFLMGWRRSRVRARRSVAAKYFGVGVVATGLLYLLISLALPPLLD